MKTKNLTTNQLHDYFSEHVRYEMKIMLNATFAIHRQLKIAQGLEYMPVESFVIHLRNLINFLYPYQPKDTDVCAKYFFIGESTWEKIRPPITEVLRKAKIRADKEVGHLTTLRKSGISTDKIWNVEILVRELMPIIVFFCKSADKVKLDSSIMPIMEYFDSIFMEYKKVPTLSSDSHSE